MEMEMAMEMGMGIIITTGTGMLTLFVPSSTSTLAILLSLAGTKEPLVSFSGSKVSKIPSLIASALTISKFAMLSVSSISGHSCGGTKRKEHAEQKSHWL